MTVHMKFRTVDRRTVGSTEGVRVAVMVASSKFVMDQGHAQCAGHLDLKPFEWAALKAALDDNHRPDGDTLAITVDDRYWT